MACHTPTQVSQMSQLLRRLGRATGFAGGTVAIALWGRFVSDVVNRPEGGGSPALAAAMVLLAVLAILSAWFDRPGALLVVFVMSFVPVGLYLLGTPSLYTGIGLANLLYLLSAALLLLSRWLGRARIGTP